MSPEKLKVRTLFLSDIHLGTKGCKAELLQDFLCSIECDTIYLVGDIFDMWACSRGSIFFPQTHSDIIRKFLSLSYKGTKIIYILGNHDEFLRKYLDVFSHTKFGNIQIVNEYIHTTADGKKLWVVHGDLWDGVTKYHWISELGDVGYTFLLKLNGIFNKFRAKFGLGYWSLSAFIKSKVKQALSFINNFEEALAKECKHNKYDGVIAGHIHVAAIKDINGIKYLNCGDFVESCTGLVEHVDGTFEIIKWHTITHTDNK